MSDDAEHIATTLRAARRLGIAQLVVLACGFLMQATAARLLDVADFGRFAAANAAGLCALVLLAGGIPQALRRTVSVDPRRIAGAMRLVALRHVPIVLVGSCLVAAAAMPIASQVGDPAFASALGLAAVELFIRAAILEPSLLLLNGLGLQGWQALAASLHGALRLACVGAALWAGWGLVGAMAGLIVAALGAGVAAAFLVLAAKKREAKGSAESIVLDAKFCIQNALSEGISHLIAYSNLFFVRIAIPSPEQVGIYASCLTISRLAQPLVSTLGGGIYGQAASSFASGSFSRAQSLIAGAVRASGMLIVPAAFLIHRCGESLMILAFGRRYAGAGVELCILSIGVGFLAVCAMLGELLSAASHSRTRLRLATALWILGSIATLIMASAAGTRGAAWGLLLTGLVGLALAIAAVRALIGPFIPLRSMAHVFAAAAPMPLLFALWGHPPTTPLEVGRDAFLGLSVYAILLAVLGEIRAPDIKRLMGRDRDGIRVGAGSVRHPQVRMAEGGTRRGRPAVDTSELGGDPEIRLPSQTREEVLDEHCDVAAKP